MTDRLRVFLVDDHDVARAGARHYLEDRFDIVGEADNAIDACIMRALAHSGSSRSAFPVEAAHTLSSRFGAATHPSASWRSPSPLSDTTFSASFKPALTGTSPRPRSAPTSPTSSKPPQQGSEAAGIEKLTPRERDVVNLIARGYTYRETAARMEISVKTLETHLRHIFDKLGVASRHELSRLAYDTGFVRPDEEPSYRGESR